MSSAAKFLGGFVVLTAVLVLGSESDQWSGVAATLAVLIAGTVVVLYGSKVLPEIDAVFGTTLTPKS